MCEDELDETLAVCELPNIASDAHLFRLGEEGVVLLEEAGEVFFLNQSAMTIWRHLDRGKSAEVIVPELQRLLQVDRDTAGRELSNTIAMWSETGLLTNGGPAGKPASDEGESADSQNAASQREKRPFAILEGGRERRYVIGRASFRVRVTGAEEARLVHSVIAHLETDAPPSDNDIVIEMARYDDGGSQGDAFVVLQNGEPIQDYGERSQLAPIVKALFCQGAIKAATYFLGIHAGVLGDGEGCLLLPATSGSGKSVLTAALCQAGYRYFSDELALIESPSFAVTSIPLGLCVKDSGWDLMARYYPQLPEMDVHLRVDGKVVRYLPPPCESRRPASESAPVRRIVFPSYDPEAATELTPLAAGVGLQRLLSQCLSLPSGLDRRRVAEMVDWIQGVPCFALRYPSLDAAVSAIGELWPPGPRG